MTQKIGRSCVKIVEHGSYGGRKNHQNSSDAIYGRSLWEFVDPLEPRQKFSTKL